MTQIWPSLLAYIITARCYAACIYATVCHLSVNPSMAFRYRDHI